MDFSFSDQQEQFRDVVARFCKDKSPPTTVRTLMQDEQGYDPTVWRQMCQEVGLLGIHVAEARGGSGFSIIELAIVMEEFGRRLMCAPYFSSGVMATTTLAEIATTDSCAAWLARLASGDHLAALAISERDGNFAAASINAFAHKEAHKEAGKDARKDANEYRLSGDKYFVVDGHIADTLLVIAREQDELALFSVAANSQGVSRAIQETMDATRKMAAVHFDQAAAVKLGNVSQQQFSQLYNILLVALANEMVGGAQALLDSAREYTQLRVQFGRTVGSFQAIKHRLADLLLEVEMAKTAAYQAAQTLASSTDPDKCAEMASLAKAAASEAYLQAGIQCIQLHGGIGFTWENDTHLWFKRAKSSETFLGGPAFHRERMLQNMLAGADLAAETA